jgi:8-oxo-dGTP diphosphatase
MHDVKAVDWLPLEDAVERLSRASEQAFLENVGPLAVQAAAVARATRRKVKQPVAELAAAVAGSEMPSLSPTEPGTAPHEMSAPALQPVTTMPDESVGAMQRVQHWLRRFIAGDRGGIR